MRKHTSIHFALALFSTQLLLTPVALAVSVELAAPPISAVNNTVLVKQPLWAFSQARTGAVLNEKAVMPLDHNGLLYVIMKHQGYKGIGVLYTEGEKAGQLATFIKLLNVNAYAELRAPVINNQENRLYISTSQGVLMAFDIRNAPDIAEAPLLEVQFNDLENTVSLGEGVVTEEGQLIYNACISDRSRPVSMRNILYRLDANLQMIQSPHELGGLSGAGGCHNYRDGFMGRPVLLNKQLLSLSSPLGKNSKQFAYDLSLQHGEVVADSKNNQQFFKPTVVIQDSHGRSYFISRDIKTKENSVVRRTGMDGPLETVYTGLLPDEGGLKADSRPGLYLVNDILYVREGTRITALDTNLQADTSAKKWVHNFNEDEFSLAATNLIITENDTLYTATNKYVYALDVQTGSVKWLGGLPETISTVHPGAMNITTKGTLLITYNSNGSPTVADISGVYAFEGDGSGLASGDALANVAMTGGDQANTGRLYPTGDIDSDLPTDWIRSNEIIAKDLRVAPVKITADVINKANNMTVDSVSITLDGSDPSLYSRFQWPLLIATAANQKFTKVKVGDKNEAGQIIPLASQYRNALWQPSGSEQYKLDIKKIWLDESPVRHWVLAEAGAINSHSDLAVGSKIEITITDRQTREIIRHTFTVAKGQEGQFSWPWYLSRFINQQVGTKVMAGEKTGDLPEPRWSQYRNKLWSKPDAQGKPLYSVSYEIK